MWHFSVALALFNLACRFSPVNAAVTRNLDDFSQALYEQASIQVFNLKEFENDLSRLISSISIFSKIHFVEMFFVEIFFVQNNFLENLLSLSLHSALKTIIVYNFLEYPLGEKMCPRGDPSVGGNAKKRM